MCISSMKQLKKYIHCIYQQNLTLSVKLKFSNFYQHKQIY